MGVVVPLIDPENYKQVRQRILKLYHDDLVRITDSHAWPRMLERDIDITDVNEILHNFKLYSSTGRLIREKNNCQYKTVINLSDIPDGIYIISVFGNNFRKSVKIIKN